MSEGLLYSSKDETVVPTFSETKVVIAENREADR
jgi:hypothetical protein